MNKEYKQWKKFLAKPYMLIILGLFYNDYLFGVNLIFNFILFRGNYRQNKRICSDRKAISCRFFLSWFSYRKTKWFWVYFCYGGVIGILLGKMLIKLYEIRITFKDINLKTKGSERFTTKRIRSAIR